MKELSNKYKVPESTIKQMVDDKVISSSWPFYEKVFYCYKQKLEKNGGKKLQAITETAEEQNVDERTVYRYIHRFD